MRHYQRVNLSVGQSVDLDPVFPDVLIIPLCALILVLDRQFFSCNILDALRCSVTHDYYHKKDSLTHVQRGRMNKYGIKASVLRHATLDRDSGEAKTLDATSLHDLKIADHQ